MTSRTLRFIRSGLVGMLAALLLLSPLAFSFAQEGDDFWEGFLFETELTADQETHDATPAVATGHAGAWFAGDGVAMNYWLSVFSTEPIIGAHFHCAPPGVNGPVVVPLDNMNPGTTTAPVSGEIGRGYINNEDIAASGADCASTIGYAINDVEDLAQALKDGMIYANIHTPSYPAGAARGQLGLFEEEEDDDSDSRREREPREPREPRDVR